MSTVPYEPPPDAPDPGDDPPRAAAPEPTRLYRNLRGVIRSALKVFYRHIEVTGVEHLDPTAPTILACNHPNSIIDPLLVGVFETRQVAFCARDGLFRVPGFGWVLREVGAIPIARRQDRKGHGGGVDNSDAFKAVRESLLAGGCVSIFPEGHTHTRLHVHKLKTGTARMAMDAEQAAGWTAGVQIVPVALNYLVRHAFRSDVHVAFGPPIKVAEEVGELARTDARAAVGALTERLHEALRDLAVHVEDEDDERIIAQVTSLMVDIRAEEGLDEGGQTPAERTALAKRVLDAYKWLEERDPQRVAVLKDRLSTYLAERAALGLGGERAALQHRGESRWAFLYGEEWQSRLLFLALGAPIAAWGLGNSVLPYSALRAALAVLKPRHDRQALTKLLAGASVFGGAWTAQTLAVTGLAGPIAGAAYAASLLPSSLFALRYATETNLHRLNLRAIVGRARARDRLEWLRRERAALRAELAELRKAYLDHVEGEENRG